MIFPEIISERKRMERSMLNEKRGWQEETIRYLGLQCIRGKIVKFARSSFIFPKDWFPDSSVQGSCLDAFKGHFYVILQCFSLSHNHTCVLTCSLPHHQSPALLPSPLASTALLLWGHTVFSYFFLVSHTPLQRSPPGPPWACEG